MATIVVMMVSAIRGDMAEEKAVVLKGRKEEPQDVAERNEMRGGLHSPLHHELVSV